MGQMAVTAVLLSAVQPTNPHATETDDIFCNIYECNAEYSGRKKGEKEWRDMMVPDVVRNTAGRRGRAVQEVWSFALAYYDKN